MVQLAAGLNSLLSNPAAVPVCAWPRPHKDSKAWSSDVVWPVQLVQALAAEVEACSGRMLSALLARLRGAIQLPECLRVVGHIRRLGIFSEDELRLRSLSPAAPPTGSFNSRTSSHSLVPVDNRLTQENITQENSGAK